MIWAEQHNFTVLNLLFAGRFAVLEAGIYEIRNWARDTQDVFSVIA